MTSGNSTTPPSAVGTNLYWNCYFSPEFPFLNRMKTAGSWSAQNADSSAIPLTADGYPTGRPAGPPQLYTKVGLDPGTPPATTNTYTLTWTGSADFTIAGAQVISREPGKIVFNYTRTDSNYTFIAVDSLDPAHPLDNMALVRTD